jgi:hypothetical protein
MNAPRTPNPEADVPLSDDENVLVTHTWKWAAASRFFPQECARLSKIEREGKHVMSNTTFGAAPQHDIEKHSKAQLGISSSEVRPRLHGAKSRHRSSDAESPQISRWRTDLPKTVIAEWKKP